MGIRDYWEGSGPAGNQVLEKGSLEKIVKAVIIGLLTVLVKVLADNWGKEGGEE